MAEKLTRSVCKLAVSRNNCTTVTLLWALAFSFCAKFCTVANSRRPAIFVNFSPEAQAYCNEVARFRL